MEREPRQVRVCATRFYKNRWGITFAIVLHAVRGGGLLFHSFIYFSRHFFSEITFYSRLSAPFSRFSPKTKISIFQPIFNLGCGMPNLLNNSLRIFLHHQTEGKRLSTDINPFLWLRFWSGRIFSILTFFLTFSAPVCIYVELGNFSLSPLLWFLFAEN